MLKILCQVLTVNIEEIPVLTHFFLVVKTNVCNYFMKLGISLCYNLLEREKGCALHALQPLPNSEDSNLCKLFEKHRVPRPLFS